MSPYQIVQNANQFTEFDNHEKIIPIEDSETNLVGFIAIHNTALGPATGGTRMFAYESNENALRDVLALSRAMTYKCALAGVPYGGGKAVIIGSASMKSENLLRAYARIVHGFSGKFTTGTDVGITDEDTKVMAETSPYIFNGKRRENGYTASDMAALGVFYSIKVAMRELFGSGNLEGKTFAVKGVGKVGNRIVSLLYGEKGKVFVADVDVEKCDAMKRRYPRVEIVNPKNIHKEKVDVYVPCALGGEFDEKTAGEVWAHAIVGAANNQLVSSHVGDILYRRGILYAPDYVASAGGLINVVDELEEGGYTKDRVLERVRGIGNTLQRILNWSKERNIAPHHVADLMAEAIIYTPYEK